MERGFFYLGDRLKVGTPETHLDVEELARRNDGPVYIYDLDLIEARFRTLDEALMPSRHTLHYAMKANSNPSVLARLASLGAGCDTVSGGEIRRALEAGFKPSTIVFSGVAKSVAEIELAVSTGIKQINVESPQELRRILMVAEKLGKSVDVAFRLNPDVSPQTHPYITTGFRENKFGMDESFIPELVSILNSSAGRLRLRGLTMHIGSQLFDLAVLREAAVKTLAVHKSLVAQGFTLDRFDAGGGLGVDYDTADESRELQMMRDYGAMVRECVDQELGKDAVEILTEPGRCLVARAGLLVGEVQYVKRAPAKTFAILNTGMNHLIRPALYSAKHRVLPLGRKSGSVSEQIYDVVGPICESSDFLAKNVTLRTVEPGDRLGIADAGAYGYAMASRYNSYDLPLEIAVSKGHVVASN